MTNPWLMAAAGLSVLIALARSVIGEYRLFQHVRRAGHLVPTESGALLREFPVRILWGTWHGLSAMGLGSRACCSGWNNRMRGLASAGRVEWCVATAMAAIGAFVWASNRSRRPAWLALFGVAALTLMSR
jgi:hypothetical protein